MKIKGYLVIQEADPDALQRTVMKTVSGGWEPIGGIAVDASEPNRVIFLQTMVQYEDATGRKSRRRKSRKR